MHRRRWEFLCTGNAGSFYAQETLGIFCVQETLGGVFVRRLVRRLFWWGLLVAVFYHAAVSFLPHPVSGYVSGLPGRLGEFLTGHAARYMSGLLPGFLSDAGVLTPPGGREGGAGIQRMVRVYLHGSGEIVEMPLDEYLVGVLAAEMPAEFPEEALKAQAVTSRTYILKRLSAGGLANPLHPGADVCDDHRHGQAWISKEEMRDRWGLLNFYKYYYKLTRAVDETYGEVITYNGELIDPVFHASCGGRTENSEDVWKFKVPYLRSVSCPYDDYQPPDPSVRFTLDQVGRAVGTDLNALAVSTGGGNGNLIRVLDHTSTGRPKTVRIGDKTVPAAVLRDKLGLKSTNFRWKIDGKSVVFTTTGYGHGVGFCQYGAKGMAEHGYDYKNILAHYFTGVEIERFK